jgi:transposase
MQPMYYIGLDVHKQKISYCVKDSSGKVFAEGSLPATRLDLDLWMKTLPQPWSAAMEATMFSGWIYDHLKPQPAELKVAHPLAISANFWRATRISMKDCILCCGCAEGR